MGSEMCIRDSSLSLSLSLSLSRSLARSLSPSVRVRVPPLRAAAHPHHRSPHCGVPHAHCPAAELRVGSLFQLAAMHAYCGLWPADSRSLEALVEPPKTAPVTEPVSAAGGTLVVPNLGGCIEYTGQPLDLEAPVTLALGATAEGGDASLASLCLLYTSPSPRDLSTSRMPSSA